MQHLGTTTGYALFCTYCIGSRLNYAIDRDSKTPVLLGQIKRVAIVTWQTIGGAGNGVHV